MRCHLFQGTHGGNFIPCTHPLPSPSFNSAPAPTLNTYRHVIRARNSLQNINFPSIPYRLPATRFVS